MGKIHAVKKKQTRQETAFLSCQKQERFCCQLRKRQGGNEDEKPRSPDCRPPLFFASFSLSVGLSSVSSLTKQKTTLPFYSSRVARSDGGTTSSDRRQYRRESWESPEKSVVGTKRMRGIVESEKGLSLCSRAEVYIHASARAFVAYILIGCPTMKNLPPRSFLSLSLWELLSITWIQNEREAQEQIRENNGKERMPPTYCTHPGRPIFLT